MVKPEIPHNEEQRLADLYSYHLLDTDPEEEFDEIVKLASYICKAPISLITLVDESRQWFKAKLGLEQTETSRDEAFCAHAINDTKPFIVEDALDDDRFIDNPLVAEDPNIRFYAGLPLKSPKGFNLGTLCVLDRKPRVLDDSQINALEILSKQITQLLALRRKNFELEQKVKEVDRVNMHLEHLNHINNQIASIISHDLRGPLSSISSFFEAVTADEKSIEQIFPLVQKSIKGMNLLIENLLEWSRNQGEVTLKPVQLDDVITEVLMLNQMQFDQKNIAIKYDQSDVKCVLCDLGMIRFVVRNLIANAIKYTENGTINIKVIDKVHSYYISITDSGIGMNKEQLTNLLEGNKKVSIPGTRNEKGSGLGIALSREFLHKHDTDLKIESKEGEGTKFSFSLPKC
jgi:signal transduction histidine kinase